MALHTSGPSSPPSLIKFSVAWRNKPLCSLVQKNPLYWKCHCRCYLYATVGPFTGQQYKNRVCPHCRNRLGAQGTSTSLKTTGQVACLHHCRPQLFVLSHHRIDLFFFCEAPVDVKWPFKMFSNNIHLTALSGNYPILRQIHPVFFFSLTFLLERVGIHSILEISHL